MELNFNSVETIPNLNASAAFQVDSGKVFKEDTDIVPVIVDDTLSYVPWGGDNAMPYNILELIESDETLSTCQMFNAEVCYGSGLNYNTDECSASVRADVQDFALDNALPSYFLGVCQDFKHFAFCVSVIILNADGTKIVRLLRKEACYCRLSPADKDGAIRQVLYANWRQSVASRDDIEVIELLDINTPWRDLANLCGFTDHRWANYLGLRSKVIDIEREIANDYVSPEQLAVFHDEVFSVNVDFSLTTSQHTTVLQRLRSIIVKMLQGEPTPVQSLRDIVDFMRKNESQFAEFRHSETYRLFEPPIFENKKKNHGYFF